ncbi:MAG TPA: UvrD-helicase domain-containing protein [Ignavibacteria bacterium]|nr:UvrD-helicase domain-containing protein [Ignavibacteria bacterium]
MDLIESTEGIYLVDAGAGTGKTYSIVNRYKNITDKNVDPEDILLVTFTVNAANQMKQKIIKSMSGRINVHKLLEAPVMTFHSFCSLIVKKYGVSSPAYLGLKNYLPANFDIVENSEFESELFRKFFMSFTDRYRNKYQDLFYILQKESDNILKIIKKLCSLGIYPEDGKWSKEAHSILKGNYKAFSDLFDDLNKPVASQRGGEKINELKNRFSYALKDKLYPDLDEEEIYDEKRVNSAVKDKIFYDDFQDEYIEFLKDIYIEYLEFLLERNQINFEFMVMFAYLTLLKNKNVREKTQFEYVMIDEFQDTDEIQFKLIMLLCKNVNNKINLCAVGDWKQGIYGFRNTKIENITQFGNSLSLFKDQLNQDETRINYDVTEYKKITFENNYRSSIDILEFSRETLFVKGSAQEEVDSEIIDINFKEALKEKFNFGDHTEINFYQANDKADEYQLVLKKISELLNEKEKYRIRVYNKATFEIIEERPVKYSDICVLSRNKKFCLELQREAIKAGIPANYGGGLEIFSSEQGIIVLAWLRLLSDERDILGWIPVLEKDGYTYPEIKGLIEMISENGIRLIPDIPESADVFLKHLKSIRNNLLAIVGEILGRYNFNDAIGNKIISIISAWNKNDLISLNELIRIIDRSKNSEHKIVTGENTDAVLMQTIHASKGLEYPVVILSNVNKSNFPVFRQDSGSIYFHEISGIRAKKFFADKNQYYYMFDNWKSDLMRSICKKNSYDEDRRLLYVAVTRAMQYLFVTAYSPSSFMTSLSERTGKEIIENFDHEIISNKSDTDRTVTKINLPGKIAKSKKFISPHLLMELSPETEPEILQTDAADIEQPYLLNKSRFEFGRIVHEAANKIANGVEIKSEIDEINRIKNFIDSLNAKELKPEIDFLYPKEDKVIRGTIDLLAIYDDRIEIIDYKTDRSRKNEDKYRIQLGIYKDVIKELYKEKKVICKLYYVRLNETIVLS